MDEILKHKIQDKPLQRIFVSYAHADGEFVNTLYARLVDAGAVVWLDRHELQAGPVQLQVARAVSNHDVVILVLSANSVESDWVENELEMAREKEKKEKRTVLCPISLDGTWQLKTTDQKNRYRTLWRNLRANYVLDFSKWNHAGFEEPFSRLVQGLKTNYEPPKRG
jgi:hypothetical protein